MGSALLRLHRVFEANASLPGLVNGGTNGGILIGTALQRRSGPPHREMAGSSRNARAYDAGIVRRSASGGSLGNGREAGPILSDLDRHWSRNGSSAL